LLAIRARFIRTTAWLRNCTSSPTAKFVLLKIVANSHQEDGEQDVVELRSCIVSRVASVDLVDEFEELFQRFFWAAAIFYRASGESFRFFGAGTVDGADFAGRPRRFALMQDYLSRLGSDAQR
jgi:hypothetical protein